MNGRWNPTNHTISDFKDWDNDSKLVIQPDFQRKAVWNATSKVMLIDTILKKYPIPKVFIQNTSEDGRTIRKIIDGQQRITAILEFVNNKFILDKPYSGVYEGKTFSELPQNERENILQYTIDCNEAYGYTDEQYREIYTRLNKYTVPLNSQELRKAEFPGNFYQLSEKLAASEILDNWKIFTISSRRRLLDVEFISEILAALLEGPQDKKSTLDNFYKKYNNDNLEVLERRFQNIIEEIGLIFPNDTISKTRFKQKADFYSLVLSIDFFTQKGLTLKNKNVKALREDFLFLDREIDPSEESHIKILQEYAIRCLSSANTASSRKWRLDFLKLILSGSYLSKENFINTISEYKNDFNLKKFLELYDLADPIYQDTGMCPLGASHCKACDDEIDLDTEEWSIGWYKQGPFQSSNLTPIHKKCFSPESFLEYKSSFYTEEKSKFIDDLFKGLEK
ncbi:hypothetical protein J587_1169 [Acinetobacter baumannii 144107]|uniref:DUF262 domain-containing protein n=1 Tax=Acinetobacter baumannii TaxID=470 RepID=UPI000451B1CF|nr:DUF262 domain-containing protein [Acinetobacter baumannii]EHU1482705.1 DUF262 domain-containing protein [Acinetobacter baumannii]EHU2703018.1 DUF262 domain-containing protein [Acinetobacter baumannii]EKV0482187.1 DUF262 domain-containing protein [Acinetobacter baumannii]EKW6894212.1 DUF262 domain-containing protein [Acinetobacter baumannii]EXE74097.1 hypothetical protein J587_1169 [Acinetobacter baumannii 144107]